MRTGSRRGGAIPLATPFAVGALAIALSLAPPTRAGAEAAADLAPAEAPVVVERPVDWTRLTLKTATYQTMSALGDMMSSAVFGGDLAVSAAAAATTLATEPALYAAHEAIWGRIIDRNGWSEGDVAGAKTATYAAISLTRSFVAGWVLLGDPAAAAGYAALGTLSDAASYAVNDALWSLPPAVPDQGARDGLPD